MLFKELENSKERISEWALERVKKFPKVMISIFDEDSGESVDVEVVNSTARELQGLVSRVMYRRYDDYKKGEIVEELIDLLTDGFRDDHPVCAWSEQEMIDWIWGNVVDASHEKWEDGLLESLMWSDLVDEIVEELIVVNSRLQPGESPRRTRR